MKTAPFKDLRAAYQLHYYLCLRTKRNQPIFSPPIRSSLQVHMTAICERCQFHVLECQPYENNLRILLSLRPEHAVADAVKKIRGNLSRELRAEFSVLEAGRVWSRGYFAKSTGKEEDAVLAKYIASQAEHHGYTGGSALLVCGYDEPGIAPALWFHNHAAFNLTHHLILETERHTALFDDVTGSALIEYWQRVAKKKEFQIARSESFPITAICECVCCLQ